MTPDYNVLYKRIGVRRVQQLINPVSHSSDMFIIPKASTLHFVNNDPVIKFPDSNDKLYSNFTKRINVVMVDTLDSLIGGVRPLNRLAKIFYKDWAIRNNARFKIIPKDAPEPNEPLSLNIYDYSFLSELYKYSPVPISDYYKWFNLNKTVWSNVNKSAKETKRNQFVFMDLPTIIPSPNVLRYFSHKVTPQILKIFDTDERRNVLELWKWIDSETRADSTLSVIEDDQLPLANIVFRYKNRITLLNLGVINKWKTDTPNPEPNVTLLKPEQLQRFSLKFLLGFQSELASNNGDVMEVSENTDDPSLAQKDITPLSDVYVEQQLSEHYDATSIDSISKSIDEELKDLDAINVDIYNDTGDVDTENSQPKLTASEDEIFTLRESIYTKLDPNEALKSHLDKLSENGVLTATDYRSLVKQVEASKLVKSPYDGNKTIEEYTTIKPEELQLNDKETAIADIPIVTDKGMLQSTLLKFDSRYTKDVLPKDIVSNIHALKSAGFIIKDYQIEEENTAMGQYEFHTVKIRHIRGADSTLHFRIPKISEEGDFTVSGNKCRMRKQRGDLPIRKINPTSVALTSYYGKVFVNRCERKQFDELEWLCETIMSIGIAGGNDTIKKIAPANVFDNSLSTPLVYGSISKRFKTITTNSYTLLFDYQECLQTFDASVIKYVEQGKYTICGYNTSKNLVVMDRNNQLYLFKDKDYTPIGTIYDVLMIDASKSPINFTELKVFSKAIPLGVVMGYYIGLTKLIKLMNVKPTILESNKRYTLNKNEWILQFKDFKLIFSKLDILATMMLSGFNYFKDSLRNYTYMSFDEHNVYLNILDQRDIGARYLKELDTLKMLFVDPITEGILKDMHEPITFMGLLLRSNELLVNNWHPDTSDMRYMRIKGYERVAGMLYREMIATVRDFNGKSIQNKSQISMNPYAVWNAITKDQTVKMSEDINPINALKEVEAVTYVGADGRSKDAMNAAAREYHISDIGVISETTVDSSEVSINTYTTSNPGLKNLRGITDIYNTNKGATGLLSTSAVLNPFTNKDDPKRVNFLGIQNSHTVACKGYHQPYVRTGYEYILPFRNGKMYSYMATDDGIVTSLTDKVIEIEYSASKERVGVKLGNQIGKSEGSFYVHPITTPLKLNQKFKRNAVIAYNSNFYEPDILDPSKVIFKNSLAVKTVVMETTQTLDDSCSVSKKLSDKLNTNITKERTFTVRFDQNIRNVIPEGSDVKYKDVLFIIEDAITGSTDVFDEDTIETLTRLSNLAPKAKVNGKLERYEVFYNGELEDMSPTLRKLVTQTDKNLSERTSLTENHIQNGRVNEEYRIEGKSLQVDSLVIKVYLVSNDNVGIGDKLTSVQLKSTVSEVFDYPMRTEGNEDIDYIFGYKSISARIVLSPVIIGTTTTLLKVLAKKAVEVYNK